MEKRKYPDHIQNFSFWFFFSPLMIFRVKIMAYSSALKKWKKKNVMTETETISKTE